jgi:peptidoglycan/xylan/chitin deacetylase (PgdA/CDA1 family)
MAQSFNRGNFPVGQVIVNRQWTSRALQGKSILGSNLAADIKQCNNQNDWAITYDDGPGIHTGKVLQSLRQRNIIATFFVVGNQIINYPDLLRQAYNEGHEIVLHSW